MGEITAQGAAFLAGLGVDFWSDLSDLIQSKHPQVYDPQMRETERTRLLEDWKRAVDRARNWVRKPA